MWSIFNSSKYELSEDQVSPSTGRKEIQVYNCGLSSSVYQRCYPVSLTRKASLCSIGTCDGSDHPSGYYGGFNNNNNNNLAEDDGHGSQWDDNQTERKAEEDRNVDYLDDATISCCYEEECGFGLHDLLTEKLEEQITPLLQSVVAASPSTSVVFPGLSSVLSMAINDILRLSEDEPYGIRGATVILKLGTLPSSARWIDNSKVENKERTLGIIALDQAAVSTFEVTLVLFEEKHFAVSLKNWLKATIARGSAQVSVISPKYLITKKKLYR